MTDIFGELFSESDYKSPKTHVLDWRDKVYSGVNCRWKWASSFSAFLCLITVIAVFQSKNRRIGSGGEFPCILKPRTTCDVSISPLKVKLSLCFLLSTKPWRRVGKWRYSSTHSTSAVDGSGQLHAPACLPPGKDPLGTQRIGGWVDPRAILDAVVKRKIPSPHPANGNRLDTTGPILIRF